MKLLCLQKNVTGFITFALLFEHYACLCYIVYAATMLLPTIYVLTINETFSNEVLHKVLSQGTSDIQVVKLLAITDWIIK